jgi:hypothetical protein
VLGRQDPTCTASFRQGKEVEFVRATDIVRNAML